MTAVLILALSFLLFSLARCLSELLICTRVRPRGQENPFHQRSAALRASGASSSPTPPTPTLAGPGALSLPGLAGGLSADIVEAQLATLACVPEYIRLLEQRERAAQRSAEAKTRRITRLEEQVQQCVSRSLLHMLRGAGCMLTRDRGGRTDRTGRYGL